MYDEVVKLVKEYLKPASYLVHRNTFRQRMQAENESISEYVAALQTLANDCKFSDIDEQILDQLIPGLKTKSIKAELLKMENPTLDRVLKKALGSEAADSGVEKLQKVTSHQGDRELHKINPGPKSQRENKRDKQPNRRGQQAQISRAKPASYRIQRRGGKQGVAS